MMKKRAFIPLMALCTVLALGATGCVSSRQIAGGIRGLNKLKEELREDIEEEKQGAFDRNAPDETKAAKAPTAAPAPTETSPETGGLPGGPEGPEGGPAPVPGVQPAVPETPVAPPPGTPLQVIGINGINPASAGYLGNMIPVYNGMVMASSVKSEKGQDHSPFLAFDGNPVSSWQDGGNREIGEFVEVDFGQPVTFNRLLFYNGNFRSYNWFLDNIVPTRFTMTADNEQCDLILGSDFCPKLIQFNRPVTARRVRFTVTDFQYGRKYRDTVIADINFLYLP